MTAFESTNRFPIDLEWMVDLFKYKHISSLTTHLKRHFREKREYEKKPEGEHDNDVMMMMTTMMMMMMMIINK